MRDGFWFSEKYTDELQFLYKVNKIYHHGRTELQTVDILDVGIYGKTLFLDGKIQSAAIDEAIYHEALVHPAMVTHPNPQNVLIAGGGEGATLREVLKHSSVKRAVMVDIDGELVELCRKYMPEWSQGAFEDPRTELVIGDAREYIFNSDEKFDVIISDLTEPLEEGPSMYLFTKEFYDAVKKRLNDDGLLVVQSGSADIFYHQFFANIGATLRELFPVVRGYHAFMFSFNMDWAFTIASKRYVPDALTAEDVERRLEERGVSGLVFYHSELHRSLFVLPLYLKKSFESRGKVITDANPFIWKA
ncbi:MAG: spermidine synthase [Candidatus Hydrothermota bacterium]|nr:MAG: spermidine synthase [Candidatus Hydrothermae bacterium]